MQTYSNLKKKELISKIERLNKDISILVNEPDSEDAIIIKHRIIFEQDLLKLIWNGNLN